MTEVNGACYLCGTEAGTTVLREGRYSAKQCTCGLVFVDPQPPEGSVDPCIDHHNRTYYSQPAALRLAWLRRFVPSGRILDVGCGEGEFAAAAVAGGFSVDGVDPSVERAQIAEGRTGMQVWRGLIEETRLQDQSYDGVFHVDLLSHFPDPLRSLDVMRRCLKTGGVMCFEVGLFSSLSPFWRKLAGRGNMPAHRWFYDEPSLRELLDRAGFEVVEIKRFSIGLSTAITSLGLALFPSREIASGATMLSRPVVSGKWSDSYYRFQGWLRYGAGARLRIGGPQVAFVAARPKSEPIDVQ